MSRLLLLSVALLFASPPGFGEEPAKEAEDQAQATEENGDGIERPKTMSGMSILGNEEAPKSLVIIPWKSSRLGDDISLSDTLDDRAQPVDKEVFLRELNFYEIRAGKQVE
ncbi:MAG: hypothetical protein KAJ57_03145 [Woeseiaceae bacterium]|nr:hypothetical protein [Woeseiaceae bacterium]